MFVITFRTGTESHDVYTYGPWLQITCDDPDAWSFALAESWANIRIGNAAGYDGCWQIARIERIHTQGVEVGRFVDEAEQRAMDRAFDDAERELRR